MAKLFARHRTIVATYERTFNFSNPRDKFDPICGRCTFNFMSDGHVLFQFKHWFSDGRSILSSWKDKGKLNFEEKQTQLRAYNYERIYPNE